MILDPLIGLPIVTGLVLLMIPGITRGVKVAVSLLVAVVGAYEALQIYLQDTKALEAFDWQAFYPAMAEIMTGWLRLDALSSLILLFIAFFTLAIMVYGVFYFGKEGRFRNYYPYLLWTLGAANGAAMANNLLLFLCCWGFLAITLYLLIPSDDDGSAAAANKSLIIIGGSDVIMLFGIGLVWKMTETLEMAELAIPTSSTLAVIAFIALLIGAFTKAGAFPFHTWIPDFTQNAAPPISSYLPGSLDKLLGIYFMARLCNEMFVLNQWLIFTIILLGVSTIIIAVMMALIQHDYRKLLGYHAVSQVGYMVTGLALGTTIGIVGGLFHMINNALYKGGLFLVAGNVKRQTGETEIDRLGGLSNQMPVTFISALVCALAISGIPPLNGFASKWLIYQGIIDFGRMPGIANDLWMLWLGLAVVGSALTLASFIKFISAIFLGRRLSRFEKVKEAPVAMLAPLSIMAALCLAFGVFATRWVIPKLFEGIVGPIAYTGIWEATTVSWLIVVSIIVGLLVYWLGSIKHLRRADSFVGGEQIQEDHGFAVGDFYNTIREFRPLSYLYDKAEDRWFDLYELSRSGVLRISHLLRHAHTGILTTYIIWLVMGLLLILMLLLLI